MPLKVPVKFLVVGFFYLAHEYSNFISFKEELEVNAPNALTDEVNFDVEYVFPCPHGSGSVIVIVDGKRAFAHEANSEVYSVGRITLFKRNTGWALAVQ